MLVRIMIEKEAVYVVHCFVLPSVIEKEAVCGLLFCAAISGTILLVPG